MGIGIEIDIYGDVQMNRELMRFGKRAQNPRPAFEQMGEYLFEVERRQFQSEGRFGGAGWPPLKKPTNRPMLQDTGALYDSLTTPNAEGSLFDIGGDNFVFGTSVPYARFHQHGTSKMAQRKVVSLRARDRVALVKILQVYLRTGSVSWDSAAVT